MSDFNIIFFGTPDFAVPSIDILLKNGFHVEAVVTSPDRPAGRGLRVKKSAVKEFAEMHGIKVLQPDSLKNEDFLNELRSIRPQLHVVVAFRKLPEAVWALPEYGTINLHASKLPQYRGAAPINWAIMNGEKYTGTTTFFINHNIDTGDMIMQCEVPIEESDTAGSLHDKLCYSGAELLLDTVRSIQEGKNPRAKQDLNEELKKAPKLSKDICRIDWEAPMESIYNKIRGLSPYPAAWTILDSKNFKIYESYKISEDHQWAPGSVINDKKQLKIAVNGGFICPTIVQLEGKKKMEIDAFLRGYDISDTILK